MKKDYLNRQERKESIRFWIDTEALLNGPLQEVATRILNLEREVKAYHNSSFPDYTRFELDLEKGYEGSDSLNLYGVRWETDTELKDRIEDVERRELERVAKEKAMEVKKEDDEKKLYIKLKQKYDKKRV